MSSGHDLDEAADRELVRRHGRLGDRIGLVDELAVERLAAEVVAEQARGAAGGERRGGPVLDDRGLRAGEEIAAARGHAGALEAEVLAHAATAVDDGQERGRHREGAALAPVEAELAHPRVDQPRREALRGDRERVARGQREALGIEAHGCERLTGGVAEHRHADDLDRGAGRGEADPERVEADAHLVVREGVVDVPAMVVGETGEAAEHRSLELRRRREDLLAEELEPERG